MKEKKPSEYLTEFLNFITVACSQREMYGEYINREDKLTQDLLHSLELDNLPCAERSKLATKLAINRKDRRYYKDRVEELEPIAAFFSDPQNKKVLDKLAQVLGAVRKQEKYHETRAYKPRVLKEGRQ